MASYPGLNLGYDGLNGLAEMLDPNIAHARARPESQRTGFSNEAESRGGDAANGTTTEGGPGGISMPSTAVDVHIGLPEPSQTQHTKEKEALLKRSKLRKFPVGEDIWHMDEVTQVLAPAAEAAIRGGSSGISSSAQVPTRGDKTKLEAAGRQAPEYDVLYQEKIGAEDVYLGVDFEKDGSTASSEGVLVKVQLPKLRSSKGIQLDVTAYSLKLQTPTEYFVNIPLPMKVIENRARAKWDGAKKVLSISLFTDASGTGKVKVM